MEYSSFATFLQTKNKPPENEDQIKQAWKVFDKNGTGTADVNELKHALTTLGEKLTAEEVNH